MVANAVILALQGCVFTWWWWP